MGKIEFGLELFLGALFVMINAYERFNTPSIYRSTTTALRYYTAVGMYVAIACCTFVVLSQYHALLALIPSDSIPADVKNLPAPLVAALALTVLLDKMPFFAPLDRWLRQKLQYIANIPYEARRLSHRLQRADFAVADDVQLKVRHKLLSSGFREQDIQFERNESFEYLWTKISVLLEHLSGWEGQRKFNAFMVDFAEEFKSLKLRYDPLSQKARRYLHHMRDLPQERSDVRSVEIGDAYRSYLREQAEELLIDLCGFLSRGILQCSVVHGTRGEELRALGFRDEAVIEPSRLSFHQLVSLFAVTATVLLFGMVLASKSTGDSFGKVLGMVVMVATIYSFAIVCALHPKDHWEIARKGAHGERPAAFYLIAGVLAALTGLMVNFVFKVMMSNWPGALKDLAITYPWLLCSFGTAITMAYLGDNRGDEYGDRQRWVEGELQALSMMLSAYVTHLWLISAGYYVVRQRDPQEFLLYLVGLAAFNGFALGFLVPTWYRRSRRGESEHERDQHPAPAAATTVVVGPLKRPQAPDVSVSARAA